MLLGRWLLVVLIVVSFPGSLLLRGGFGIGPSYYFAAAGSDSNDCSTPAKACQTISHANGLTFNPDSQILFNGGDTFSGSVALTTSNAPSGRVTVSSYGTGQPTISSGNSAVCVSAVSLPSITVNNLICVGGGNTTNSTAGISITNGQGGNTKLAGPTITNNTVSGYGIDGIAVLGTNGTSGFSFVVVSNNTVHDSTGNEGGPGGGACIRVRSVPGYGTRTVNDHVTINSNLVYNCTGQAAQTNWSGSGIIIGETTTGVMSFNVAHDSGSLSTSCGGPVGIWTIDSDSIVISYDEAYNITTGSSCDGGGFDLDGGVINSIIEYTYSHNNYGPGLEATSYGDGTIGSWSNNTFRYNIVEKSNALNEEFNIIQDAAISGIYIYGNTIVSNDDPIVCNGSSNVVSGYVANNIFIGVNGVDIVYCPKPGTLSFQGNDYFGSTDFTWGASHYTTFAAWKSGSGQETANGGLAVDPKLTNSGGGGTCGSTSGPQPCPNAYTLQAGSPALSVGIDLTQSPYNLNVGATDYYGNPIPTGAGTGYNIGAY